MQVSSIRPIRTYPVAAPTAPAAPIAPEARIDGFRAEIANSFRFTSLIAGSWGKPKPPKPH